MSLLYSFYAIVNTLFCIVLIKGDRSSAIGILPTPNSSPSSLPVGSKNFELAHLEISPHAIQHSKSTKVLSLLIYTMRKDDFYWLFKVPPSLHCELWHWTDNVLVLGRHPLVVTVEVCVDHSYKQWKQEILLKLDRSINKNIKDI